jgi:hypothetical protein
MMRDEATQPFTQLSVKMISPYLSNICQRCQRNRARYYSSQRSVREKASFLSLRLYCPPKCTLERSTNCTYSILLSTVPTSSEISPLPSLTDTPLSQEWMAHSVSLVLRVLTASHQLVPRPFGRISISRHKWPCPSLVLVTSKSREGSLRPHYHSQRLHW